MSRSGGKAPRERANLSELSRLQLNTMTKRRIHFERAGHRPSSQCSGEFMKISKSLIAAAAIASLPLAAFAGDKDKTVTPVGAASSAQFDTLDTNRDGRISRAEATSDSKIVFSSADKNGDGYLDNSEYTHRSMTTDPMPTSDNPATDSEQPRK
jgi:EF hand